MLRVRVVGPFIVFNEVDEKATLRRWFDHMRQVHASSFTARALLSSSHEACPWINYASQPDAHLHYTMGALAYYVAAPPSQCQSPVPARSSRRCT